MWAMPPLGTCTRQAPSLPTTAMLPVSLPGRWTRRRFTSRTAARRWRSNAPKPMTTVWVASSASRVVLMSSSATQNSTAVSRVRIASAVSWPGLKTALFPLRTASSLPPSSTPALLIAKRGCAIPEKLTSSLSTVMQPLSSAHRGISSSAVQPTGKSLPT